MKKSGLADSPFFTAHAATKPLTLPDITASSVATEPSHELPTQPPSYQGSVVARYHATLVEYLRKSVKEPGKEAATYRFTLTEKRLLAIVVHALHMQGIRTTENEIARIAVNFLLQDYQADENNSLLQLVLQALRQ